jgi:hypothetical protein
VYSSSTNVAPVFVRVILNRDTAYLGTQENIMLQVEYQATGLRTNSDGISVNPEENLDQLWKVFWGQTLLAGTSYTPFSIFIPPNYTNWCSSGSGQLSASPVTCTTPSASLSSPTVVRQMMIPISAYPKQTVIQLQRVRGRGDSDQPYLNSFCQFSDSPLCLGVVFRSLTILRM